MGWVGVCVCGGGTQRERRETLLRRIRTYDLIKETRVWQKRDAKREKDESERDTHTDRERNREREGDTKCQAQRRQEAI